MSKKDNFDLSAGGVKEDAEKIRVDLVPMDAVFAAGAVFTYGAIKYDDWNWAKGMRRGRLLAAALRHLGSYTLGSELDEESGLPHTWHLLCCVMMLVSGDLRGVATEDRSAAVDALMEVQAKFAAMNIPEKAAEKAVEKAVEKEAVTRRRMSAAQWRALDERQWPRYLRMVKNPSCVADRRVGQIFEAEEIIRNKLWETSLFEEVIAKKGGRLRPIAHGW